MAIQTLFRFGNHTDVGLVRRQNEDSMGYFDTPNGHLFLVCDGMGGHLGGAMASQMAVKVVRNYFQQLHPNPYLALQEALAEANAQIFAQAQANAEVRGMGTTIVAVLLQNNLAYYAHVGDSRIYLCRNKELKRLTKDHSIVQEMIDAGMITEDEAENHPRKNELRRALGVNNNKFRADVCDEPLMLYAQDKLLLCSDGLVSLVSDKEILSVLLAKAEVQAKAMHLVDIANQRGGYDNTTVQLIEMTDSLEQAPILSPKTTSLSQTNPLLGAESPASPTPEAAYHPPAQQTFATPLPPTDNTPEPNQQTYFSPPPNANPKQKTEYGLLPQLNYTRLILRLVFIIATIGLAYYVWENSLKRVKLSNLWAEKKDTTTTPPKESKDTTQNKVLKYITDHSQEAKEAVSQYNKAKEGYKSLKDKVKKLRNNIQDIIELKGLKKGQKTIDSLLQKHEVMPYIYQGSEDLKKIAQKYNLSVREILEANNLASERALELKRDTLLIPTKAK